MKRFFSALAILAVALTAAPKAEARVDVSINFFYDNLGSDGYWLDVDGYGYCWQPTVAVSNRGWRPYADGYWAYTNVGWTWVSYESFGWATYHYGRWARLRNHGWVWVPGYEWGPAWVSWRTGGNYVGWAPLPPRRYSGGGEVIYSGRPISGYVDIDFDIGPSYYNFVDVRYIGAPVLSRHIYAPTQNITYINQTVNVTNITYNNNTVYNYGPDYDRLSAYSTQPIQRLNLERTTDASVIAGDAGGFTKVQGDKLVVAAPAVIEKSSEPVAPPAVKTKVADPNLETGWSDVADSETKAQLQAKMKKEDRNFVPPPEIEPQNPEALKGAAATTATSPADGSSPAEAAASPAATDAAAGANANADRGRGQGRNKRGEVATPPQQADAAASDAAATAPASGANAVPDQQRGRRPGRDKRGEVATQPQQPGDTGAEPPVTAPAEDANARGRGRSNQPRRPAADAQTQENAGSPAAEASGRRKRDQQQPASVPPSTEAAAAAPEAAAPQQPAIVPPRQERGPGRREAQGRSDSPANVPAREPAPDVRRRPDAPPRAIEAPGADQLNQERGNRGRGRKADRGDGGPSMQPPQEAVQPPREAMQPPREAMQPREPRMQRMPQRPPQQIAPPSAPPEGAAPQQERGRGKPDKGKKNKDDGSPGEEE